MYIKIPNNNLNHIQSKYININCFRLSPKNQNRTKKSNSILLKAYTYYSLVNLLYHIILTHSIGIIGTS